MGDLMFNPTAHPGDPDWRVLYIACGDGGSGESKNPEMRSNPQRLDTMVGKILRIIPDLNEKKYSSTVSENGRYRIPNDNPFVGKAGCARGNLGLRPAQSGAADLGCRSRQSARQSPDRERDRPEHLGDGRSSFTRAPTTATRCVKATRSWTETNHTKDLPADDRIPVRSTRPRLTALITPTYPVIQYPHVKGGGDAISSGYVYRGKAIPALRGKYIFGDISTGNLWYADYKEMLAADDGDPKTLAEMHPLKIRWTRPGGASEVYGSLSPITEFAYHARGGKAAHLPGIAKVAEGGRSDIHLWMDSAGELYHAQQERRHDPRNHRRSLHAGQIALDHGLENVIHGPRPYDFHS